MHLMCVMHHIPELWDFCLSQTHLQILGKIEPYSVNKEMYVSVGQISMGPYLHMQ